MWRGTSQGHNDALIVKSLATSKRPARTNQGVQNAAKKDTRKKTAQVVQHAATIAKEITQPMLETVLLG